MRFSRLRSMRGVDLTAGNYRRYLLDQVRQILCCGVGCCCGDWCGGSICRPLLWSFLLGAGKYSSLIFLSLLCPCVEERIFILYFGGQVDNFYSKFFGFLVQKWRINISWEKILPLRWSPWVSFKSFCNFVLFYNFWVLSTKKVGIIFHEKKCCHWGNRRGHR